MAIQRKTTSRAQRLLDHHRLRGRAYPAMRYWERLHLMLSEEAEKRGKSPPPPPLVHGGLEAEATEADRMDRLDEQVAWADHNQLLHKVQMFFDAMPGSGWEEQGAFVYWTVRRIRQEQAAARAEPPEKPAD